MVLRRPRRLRKRAFTLVEMLVVVFILGLLAALLLPAIQRARVSARIRQCQTNLHNIGIAFEQYHDQYGSYPMQRSNWGPLAAILPQVEGAPAYNAINFSFPFHHQANLTVAYTRMSLYLCPSDSDIGKLPLLPAFERSHYVGSTGSGLRPDPGVQPGDRPDPTSLFGGDGVFSAPSGGGGGIRRAGIRDGIGNTVFMSETLLGHGESGPPTVVPDVRRHYALAHHQSAEGWIPSQPPITKCANPVWVSGYRQVTWTSAAYGSGLYNHYLRPNDAQADCVVGTWNNLPPEPPPPPPPVPPFDFFWDIPPRPADPVAPPYEILFDPLDPLAGERMLRERGRLAARSLHGSGVNVLFGDGRSIFMSNNVELTVWRALATRSSSETVPQF